MPRYDETQEAQVIKSRLTKYMVDETWTKDASGAS